MLRHKTPPDSRRVSGDLFYLFHLQWFRHRSLLHAQSALRLWRVSIVVLWSYWMSCHHPLISERATCASHVRLWAVHRQLLTVSHCQPFTVSRSPSAGSYQNGTIYHGCLVWLCGQVFALSFYGTQTKWRVTRKCILLSWSWIELDLVGTVIREYSIYIEGCRYDLNSARDTQTDSLPR